MSEINKIIELLNKQGKTQKELTDYLGLDKSTFSAWKANKSQSYKKYLKEISYFLNVSPNYLLGDDNDSELPTEINSNNNVKFALFGTAEVDDDIYEQVKAFAKFALNSKKEKKDK